MPEARKVRGPSKLKPDQLVDRQRLLKEFDMITEDDLAVLFGVEVKTLKNRSTHDLPPFTKTGGKRLFFKDEVTAFMRRRMGG